MVTYMGQRILDFRLLSGLIKDKPKRVFPALIKFCEYKIRLISYNGSGQQELKIYGGRVHTLPVYKQTVHDLRLALLKLSDLRWEELKDVTDEKYNSQLALISKNMPEKCVSSNITGKCISSETKSDMKNAISNSSSNGHGNNYSGSYERVILIRIENHISGLLWSIFLETKACSVYMTTREDLSKPLLNECNVPMIIKDFLINSEKYSIVALYTINNIGTSRHVFNVTKEHSAGILSFVSNKLLESTREYKMINKKHYETIESAKNFLTYKNAAITIIVTAQLSVILYLTCAIGWDIAEPISYIISQVNLAIWVLIYLITNTMPNESFRKYCINTIVEKTRKKNNININKLSKIYHKRHNLTEILHRYRKILGSRPK